MCGISGIIKDKPIIQNDHKIIRKMAELQNHRGPDSTGFATYPQVLFAHNRLSLIDLNERSNQPFENEHYSLIYNGEIYNFQVIKDKLIRDFNVQFIGTSDTEVLFYSLITWGVEETLQLIKGMFAFSFYDIRVSKVYLVRDKIGIKPLFYRQHHGEIQFASELKAIVTSHDIIPIHRTHLMQAAFGAIENSRVITGFENVFQIEPGTYHIISFNSGLTTKICTYFKTADWIDENEWLRLNDLKTSEVDDEFEEKFTYSIKSMLVADAGMGAFVSGGIDSSINAAIAKKHRNINLYTTNVVGKFSEFEDAKCLANHLKMPLNAYNFEPDMFISDWVKTTWHYESPIVVHPSAIPFQKIAKVAQENNDKAVITGEGSDELFLGYPRLLTKRFDNLIRFPQNLLVSIYKKIPGLVRYLNLNNNNYFGDIGKMNFNYERQLKELNYQEKFSFLKGHKNYSEHLMTPSMIDNSLHSLLWRNDRMGMMHSIESRFPFLDDDVMKFALNLPVKHKIGRSMRFHNWKHPFLIDKAVVRRLGSTYLPKRLVYKKKDGFPMYGQMYMDIQTGFFQNGFWQQQMEMSSASIQNMCKKVEPYLLAKLASVEIWGRLFSWRDSIENVENHVHKFAKMKLPDKY
jgi:asparagine synthase (glutamine-hydrolysing)